MLAGCEGLFWVGTCSRLPTHPQATNRRVHDGRRPGPLGCMPNMSKGPQVAVTPARHRQLEVGILISTCIDRRRIKQSMALNHAWALWVS